MRSTPMKDKVKKLIPLPVKHFLYKIYTETTPAALSKVMGTVGYNVSRKANFYSPTPTLSTLNANRSRWDKPSELAGVEYDMDAMKRTFGMLTAEYLEEFKKLPPYHELHTKGFGLGYTPVDAMTSYLMIRHLKPKRYIEVGSGLSTYYCHLAAEVNRAEGFPLEITCIEPYPLKNLYTLPNVEIIKEEVQDVGLDVFAKLEDGDVLFIDSSHVVRIDGDVPYLFLNVLPNVAKGVSVHVHDIPFPFNTPFPADRWVFGQAEPMFWTEAMLLQAFLACNRDFEVTLSLPMIRHADEAFLRAAIPNYKDVNEDSNAFSSIWLKRVN